MFGYKLLCSLYQKVIFNAKITEHTPGNTETKAFSRTIFLNLIGAGNFDTFCKAFCGIFIAYFFEIGNKTTRQNV